MKKSSSGSFFGYRTEQKIMMSAFAVSTPELIRGDSQRK